MAPAKHRAQVSPVVLYHPAYLPGLCGPGAEAKFLPPAFVPGRFCSHSALHPLARRPDRARLSPASRLCSDRRTIVPVPASTSGDSFRPKDIHRVTARPSPSSRGCCQTLCPFSASALVTLSHPPRRAPAGPGKAGAATLGRGQGTTIRSFVPRTAGASSALKNGNTPARESHLKLRGPSWEREADLP